MEYRNGQAARGGVYMNGHSPRSSVSQNADGQQQQPKQPGSKNPRLNQNAEAVVRNISRKQSIIHEGKHAAAVDQLHENDLHGIEHFSRREEGGGADGGGDPRQGSGHGKGHVRLHLRPRMRQQPGYEDTDLTTSFDPMRDRHLWAMWRTAVNGRIMDEVRRMERSKGVPPPGPEDPQQPPRKPYGASIVTPPLKRFIKLQDGSKEIAQHLSKEGKGQLQTSQFVFYGLPRVYMERGPPNGGPPM